MRRSHSSAAGTGNRVRESEPPAVAPRHQRPISQMPQVTKRPLLPPAPYRKPSGKPHKDGKNKIHGTILDVVFCSLLDSAGDVVTKPSSKPAAHPRSPPMPRKEHRPISPKEPESREVSENGKLMLCVFKCLR